MTEERVSVEEDNLIVKTSVSLPKYLYDWLKDVATKTEFNSQSAVMVVALSELKGRMEERVKIETENTTLDDEDLPKLMLKLLSRHQELIDEVNELKRQSHDRVGYNKKVKFEL